MTRENQYSVMGIDRSERLVFWSEAGWTPYEEDRLRMNEEDARYLVRTRKKVHAMMDKIDVPVNEMIIALEQ